MNVLTTHGGIPANFLPTSRKSCCSYLALKHLLRGTFHAFNGVVTLKQETWFAVHGFDATFHAFNGVVTLKP